MFGSKNGYPKNSTLIIIITQSYNIIIQINTLCSVHYVYKFWINNTQRVKKKGKWTSQKIYYVGMAFFMLVGGVSEAPWRGRREWPWPWDWRWAGLYAASLNNSFTVTYTCVCGGGQEHKKGGCYLHTHTCTSCTKSAWCLYMYDNDVKNSDINYWHTL